MKNKGLIEQFQTMIDTGKFDRKSREMDERELRLNQRERDVKYREDMAEKKIQLMRKMQDDPILKLLEQQRQRLQECLDDLWMKSLDEQLKEEEENEEKTEKEPTEEEPEGDDFAWTGLEVDENDILFHEIYEADEGEVHEPVGPTAGDDQGEVAEEEEEEEKEKESGKDKGTGTTMEPQPVNIAKNHQVASNHPRTAKESFHLEISWMI